MGVIDRRALVGRHDVLRRSADPLEPLSVGNGELAFTVDVTGLQTIPEFHAGGMRLGTQAQWAWHSAPNPHGFTPRDSYAVSRTAAGRPVPYPSTGPGYRDGEGAERRADAWLRENPHRLDLGRIGFARADGRPIEVGDIADVDQRLDLWRGAITSRFTLDGVPVRVVTTCHPVEDVLAVRVESALLASGDLGVHLRFPYAVGDWHDPCAWDAEDRHASEIRESGRRLDIRRTLDEDRHQIAVVRSAGAWKRYGAHELGIHSDSSRLEVSVGFRPDEVGPVPGVPACLEAAERHWSRFWDEGGAIDLAGSTDPRAEELERRIVLSQYLTAVNCAGSTPPAETGLVTNSWRGKFHLEMHWWHAAHFPLWGRAHLLERSLGWYERVRPVATAYARDQGYDGARWMKQVGPEGRESPSNVGAFLVWQQPHPIYFAELIRREREDAATLRRYADLVFATAEFLASFPEWDDASGRFNLGPPLVSAQERAAGERGSARNPAFELAYWRWALGVAQAWRRRLGLDPEPRWERVRTGLAPLPIRDGRYRELETPPTEDEEHPAMVGALGFVPDTGLVDHEVMRATVRGVLDSWEWRSTWGWDYPLLAMSAARLGEPELAVDALLLDRQKNTYLANGHNFQELPKLTLYLPGNGGLLYATAMMAGGWDGGPPGAAGAEGAVGAVGAAPGFPPNGWRVRAEGLCPAP